MGPSKFLDLLPRKNILATAWESENSVAKRIPRADTESKILKRSKEQEFTAEYSREQTASYT